MRVSNSSSRGFTRPGRSELFSVAEALKTLSGEAIVVVVDGGRAVVGDGVVKSSARTLDSSIMGMGMSSSSLSDPWLSKKSNLEVVVG
jgi:hypothetical protein